jgi:hypothetical protein
VVTERTDSPAAPSPTVRRSLALVAVVIGLWLLHAAIAWLTPIQGEDWQHLTWATRQPPPGVANLFYRNRTSGDLVGVGIALSRWLHVLLTPTVVVALFAAMVTHAQGRLPRLDRPRDAVLLLFAGGLVWIVAPSPGLVLSYRPFVATVVYGVTAMLWLLAAYRFAGRPPTWPRGVAAAVGVLLLGAFAGSSTRPVGIVTALVAVIGLVRGRGGRPAWKWTGALGACAGAVLVWFDRPAPDLARFFARSVDQNAVSFYWYIGECRQLFAILGVALIACLVRRRWWGAPATMPSVAQLGAMRWAAILSVAVALIGVTEPTWGSPLIFAPAMLLITAALPAFDVIIDDRWMRRVLAVVALLPLIEVIAVGLPRYADARAQHEARYQALRATPRGSVATVETLMPVMPDAWVHGEDWPYAVQRRRVARRLYGLRDISFTAPFSIFEPTPDLEVTAAWTTGTRIDPPDGDYSPMLYGARSELRDIVRRARGAPLEVELRAGLDFPERRGRPLLVARARGAAIETARAVPVLGSVFDRVAYRVVETELTRRLPERWYVHEGRAVAAQRWRDVVETAPTSDGWYYLVLCGPAECWVAEATLVRP